jgi:hypothetical protein
MGARYSLKGIFIPKEAKVLRYGSESPGVGKYSIENANKDAKHSGPKIGTGPKCPESNFQLPTISPGPIYSNLHPTNIVQKIKAKSVSALEILLE